MIMLYNIGAVRKSSTWSDVGYSRLSQRLKP